jgi:hypothetical protein
MLWLIIFAAVALAGLTMVICYAVWLVHKASDVMSEVTVLAERGGQLVELLGQIHMPPTRWKPDPTRDLVAVDATGNSSQVDVG